MGHAPDFVLRRVDLLLEGDMRSGEALVVGEKTLDLLVLDGEVLLDDGRVRGRSTAVEAEGRAVSPHLLEERGGMDRQETWAGEERGRRSVVVRQRRSGGVRRRHAAPSRHGRPSPNC